MTQLFDCRSRLRVADAACRIGYRIGIGTVRNYRAVTADTTVHCSLLTGRNSVTVGHLLTPGSPAPRSSSWSCVVSVKPRYYTTCTFAHTHGRSAPLPVTSRAGHVHRDTGLVPTRSTDSARARTTHALIWPEEPGRRGWCFTLPCAALRPRCGDALRFYRDSRILSRK